MATRQPHQLRAAFATRLSQMYGQEVPAYNTLVQVTQDVNEQVLATRGPTAQRLGSIERVSAERHGAIRVGTPRELADIAVVFAAMGMHPAGFYDLRDAAEAAVPVVSTAFRPVDPVELERNPFRVFTSLLATSDRRFFSADLAGRLERFLARRQLFSPRLLLLADRAEAEGELDETAAEEFVELATRTFALSPEPVDRSWWDELAAVSAVAADIGGVFTTHVNHLTPRVLDIDLLYDRMREVGVEMIDTIQGPPRWDGPDVLLRQTSFRALDEPRLFVEADGRVTQGSLRVRFGEVEARGIALTRAGRVRYDAAIAEVDRRAATEGAQLSDISREVWATTFPSSERELLSQGLGVCTVSVVRDRRDDGRRPSADLGSLLRDGFVSNEPVVYEDFLPRSAVGIFRSNLSTDASKDDARARATLDAAWFEGALERTLHDPAELYERQHTDSLVAALTELEVDPRPAGSPRPG
jgi:uncharacterized glyoxalase superfamily metalloenzyme YdcJ